MFKKSERLTKAEFTEYFKNGKRHPFPHLTIIKKKHSTRKVAVVVGKKVSRSAVRRNTLKRRIYATLRRLLVGVEYKGVLIVIVKPTFNSLARKAADEFVEQSIAQVLESA